MHTYLRVKTALWGLRLLLLLAPLIPAPARAERLPLRAYTVADGLAHNQVNEIVRDSRGFLWLCTAEGLSRFDGYQFTNYTTDHGLPHPYVTDFLETRGGEIWVATYGGLVRFEPKGRPANRVVSADETDPAAPPMFAVVVPEDEDRYARSVTALVEGRDGTVWAGTRKGLLRLERSGGRFHLRPVDIGPPIEGQTRIDIWDVLEDRHGSLWVAAGALYRRRPDGGASRYTERDGLPLRGEGLHDLLEDHRGRLWAGTRKGGFFQFTADDSHAPPAVAFALTAPGGEWIYQLFETSDHKLWAATANGLIEFIPDGDGQGRRHRLHSMSNGLSDRGITALNEDPGGNLWLGSYAGAMKLARDGFLTYGEQDGLASVYAIFGDRAGAVCFRGDVFGDEGKSVFEGAKPESLLPLELPHLRYGRFDGRRFTWLKPDLLTNGQLGWVGEGVTLQARDGEWWLGTGAGLYRFPATDDFARLKRAPPLAIYTAKDVLTSPQVFRLFEDSRGDIWVSAIGPNGLARWERAGETWHDLTNAPGLPAPKDDLARSFGEDAAGNVWVGFNGGAARHRQGRFTFFTPKDGLPPGGVMNFHADRAGRLWLTSARSGLIRVDDPAAERPVFVTYTAAEGLSSNSTEAITEDLRGRIYVSTGRGLDRLDPETGHVKHFTTADGLAPGAMRAAFRDSQGALWFGTTKGLSRFMPGTDDETAQPPPILITGLRVEGVARPVSALGESDIRLPDLAADESRLQIEFTGLSFAPGEVLRYQYRLEGAGADWSALAEQRTVNLAGLAPGSYRFLVRAVNSDGLASPDPAAVTFTVLRPVWQRWWFLSLVALAVALAASALYRFRVRRLLEVANMRTRIATDLHDDIGSNLTKIAILSEVAKRQYGDGGADGDDLLTNIARISRESVASMGDIVWAINPERDHLIDLVRRMRQHAEELFAQRDVELRFNAPDAAENLRLGVDVRRDFFLVFKEAINNAARHSCCSRVEVNFRVDNSQLLLEVVDDGAGFDPSAGSEGQGLMSMRRRARSLGGALEVEAGAGRGTIVRLTVPHHTQPVF